MHSDTIIVVDMQVGFLPDANGQMTQANGVGADAVSPLPVAIAQFLDRHQFEHRIFTLFHNPGRGGFYQEELNWKRMLGPPETDLAPELRGYPTLEIHKATYSAFSNPDLPAYLADHSITSAYVCGMDTNICVTSMLCDLADRNIRPIVIADLCASHSGPEYHEAGLLSFPKWIGQANITLSDRVG